MDFSLLALGLQSPEPIERQQRITSSGLFDRLEPSEMTHSIEPVSRYVRVNRSPKHYMQTVREELEEWYARFPDRSGDLRARFRNGDTNHDGAFFELFLHELFLRLGLSVEVGPTLDSGKKPDFLVSGVSGAAYVEATYLEQTVTTPALEKPVFDALNDLDGQVPAGIGLRVEVEGELTLGPPLKPIKRAALEWLNSLDAQMVNWDSRFKCCIPVDSKYGSWRLILHAVPRLSASSLIAIGPTRISDWNPARDLRKAIEKKSHKYKRLQHPLVIAANIQGTDMEQVEMAALFGPEALQLRRTNTYGGLISEGIVRTNQGFWFDNDSGQIRNGGSSGLMMFHNLAPWTVANVTACLYLNPYVEDWVPKELRALGHASSTNSELTWHRGDQTVRAVIRLGDDWPGSTSP